MWKRRNGGENTGMGRKIQPIYRDWKDQTPIIEGKGNLNRLNSFPQEGGDRYRISKDPE